MDKNFETRFGKSEGMIRGKTLVYVSSVFVLLLIAFFSGLASWAFLGLGGIYFFLSIMVFIISTFALICTIQSWINNKRSSG
ncbi:hypothetical protein ASG89_33485 [Paenibacillus sp. Soil766]|nr:hypothetical protein ASG89_33485 [Paenibacillus sp. Soil766]